MKECPNCKTMLEDDEMFCHECGTKQEIQEAVAQNEESTATLEKKCIHCGETIEENSTFCPYCGKSQVAEEVKESEPEAEKEPVAEEKTEPKQEESPAPEEKEKPKETPVQEATEEQPHYDWEDEPKSKKWIWILLVILLAGAGTWYFFSQNVYSLDNAGTMVEVVDSADTTAVVPEEEITPISARGFLEEFYKGDRGNEDFIKQNVTANVLNKLKQDYDYDCPSNDCLATWVFDCIYKLDGIIDPQIEGPHISETDTDGKYKVMFQYTYDDNGQKVNGEYVIFLTVTNIDGRFLISDYKVQEGETDSESKTDFISEMYKDFFGNKNFDTKNIDNLRKYLSDNVIERIYLESPYDGDEGRKEYVVYFFYDGSLSVERPDVTITKWQINSIDSDWFEVVGVDKYTGHQIKVMIKVSDSGNRNYKVTDFKVPDS